MTSALLLGVLLGMRHAMESDHVAAIATLAANSSSLRRSLILGAVWGIGHTVTLALVCTAVLFARSAMPEQIAHLLEGTVGIMLLALGIDLARHIRHEGIHVHPHGHAGRALHLHVHSHSSELGPHRQHHEHGHSPGFPIRALAVGMMHGMAGSAALILVAFGQFASPLVGLVYVVLFGAGSIVGMALLSIVITLPLRWASKSYSNFYRMLQEGAALGASGVGAVLIAHQAALLSS